MTSGEPELPEYLLGTIPDDGDAGACWKLKPNFENPICQLKVSADNHLTNSLSIIRGRMLN